MLGEYFCMNQEQYKDVLERLKVRFEHNHHRHEHVSWETYLRVIRNDKTMSIINQMEVTGGEPDLVVYLEEWYVIDCSKETPKERVSICYDKDARIKRKNYPPITSAEEMALTIGIQILDEPLYRYIQTLEEFDLKTSSWLKTPKDIRLLGGAIFGDRRYNTVFVYHNGADSYYGARGFRGFIKI